MRDNNPTLEIENKDFENNTSAMPKITQSYASKCLCGQLAKQNLKIPRDNNSTLEIESKDFEHNTIARPEITQRYVSKSLCGK